MIHGQTPYLDRFHRLRARFPILHLFHTVSPKQPERVNGNPLQYEDTSTGRAAVLEFLDGPGPNEVHQRCHLFKHADELAEYLRAPRRCYRRLFLLEDLSLPFVEAFGQHLDIDPRLFASQSRCVHWDNPFGGTQRTMRSCRKYGRLNSFFFTLKYYEPWLFEKVQLSSNQNVNSLLLSDSFITRGIYGRRVEKNPIPVALVRRTRHSRMIRPYHGSISTSADKIFSTLKTSTAIQTMSWTRQPDDFEKGRAHKSDLTIPSVFTLRGNASYWCRTYSDNSKSWDGFCLVDPGLTIQGLGGKDEYKPSTIGRYQDGYPDLLQPQWSEAMLSDCAPGPVRKSMFDDILYYWTTDENWKDNIANAEVAATYLKQLVAAHWNSLLNQLWASICYNEVGNIEEFLSVHPADQEERDQWSLMEANLRHMNTLRRRLSYYVVEATENLYELDIDLAQPKHDLTDLQKDFRDIIARLELYKSSADSIMSLTGNVANLLQAKRSLVSSYFVNLLTMIGVIVFPLTFLCALFSMNGNFQAGGQLFWVYWVIAVPLAIAMLALVWTGKRRFRKKQQTAVYRL